MGLSHEIHTSERRSFKGCRLRWKWHFIDNWTPVGMAPPLEFGIAYHKAMEVLYDPEMWNWPDREVVGELAVKTFVDECNTQRRRYLRDAELEDLDGEIQKEYNERITLGKGMIRHVYRTQLLNNPENFVPVKVEIGFEVNVNHPQTGKQLRCKCDKCWRKFAHQIPTEEMKPSERIFWEGLPVTYAGRIDCLMQDPDGYYWIVDWKTARSISDDEEFLQLDDQIGSYVWALTAALGLPVRGFIYHQQKKGFPQPPQRNKHQRKGCWFSVSKAQDTDYETYLKTVQEEDAEAYEAGAYDDFLHWLKVEGPVYYKRNIVIKTEHELKSIGENIGLEALDMLDPGLRIYPNSGRFGCKYCAFRQPCIGKFRGDDYEYTLKTLFKQEAPYYERERRGPSTESKGGE